MHRGEKGSRPNTTKQIRDARGANLSKQRKEKAVSEEHGSGEVEATPFADLFKVISSNKPH